MKAHTISLTLAAALLTGLGAGCSSTSDPYRNDQTARDAAAGAAAGAVLGGVVGNNSGSGNAGRGAAIGAVAGGLAGAAVGHRADQREAAAVQNPAYPAYSPDVGYTVQAVPPAPVSEPQEAVPPQPSANAVWIRGHYDYTGSGYQWQSGRWEVPPAGAHVWVPSAWQPAANGGYVYVRGHWQ